LTGPAGGTRTWKGKAPAKVNLLLRVLAREESGYHQVETVLQALELADEVRLRLDEPRTGVKLEVVGVPEGDLGPDENNLAVRAVGLFRRAVVGRDDSFPGIGIHLEKRIPHGAGLGGGSSDAAAVMLGLNDLLGSPLSGGDLVRIGGRLGADVPFFMLRCSRALAWGRGDRLFPLSPLPVRDVLLAIPPLGISTPWAYEVLARHREATGEAVAGAARVPPGGGEDWADIAAAAVNDFEPALAPHRGEILWLRDVLREHGAAPALLSGSGSAVFGVFPDADSRERAAEAVRSAVPETRVIRSRTLSDSDGLADALWDG